MGTRIQPTPVARRFREEIREAVAELGVRLTLVGFLTSDDAPSLTYAEYTRSACEEVGIRFELRQVERLALENEIMRANDDPDVHGIIVYYPVFGTGQDAYLKDLIDYRKDIEGLNSYWTHKLHDNERFLDPQRTQKAILPCTPLAIIKLLESVNVSVPSRPEPLGEHTVTIFNRSEVVGRPLARMMANDGALVYSFDIDGPILFRGRDTEETAIERRDALSRSTIVISGVPSRDFPLIRPEEIPDGAVCMSFATVRNFADTITDRAALFIPRVGPMTITMALRNTVRLYRVFRLGTPG
jgi:methylenetetrahydrofolate dehydrogenase (NADP+)/methenyltetrahydrofolate cyclohydrolase